MFYLSSDPEELNSVQSQDHMQPLSRSELNCLRAISQCGDITPQAYFEPDLLRLIELGLVEKVSLMWLPLEMKCPLMVGSKVRNLRGEALRRLIQAEFIL